MKRNEIVILHCSDLHYGFESWKNATPDDIRLRKARIEGFLEIIESFPDGWQPSILIISGDIAWSGAEKEYKTFIDEFLQPTLRISGICIENVILCIGNHDKDDNISAHLNKPDSQDVTSDELHPAILAPWLQYAFPAFLDMCELAGINKLENSISTEVKKKSGKKITPRLKKRADYVYGYRQINDIDFLVLNSAWDCNHNRKTDLGLIRIGRQLYSDTVNQVPFCEEKCITISVLHHPFHWFHSCEKEVIDTIKSTSDIVLYGHEHEFNESESEGCVLLASSTLSSNDTVKFGFELVKISYSPEGLSPTLSIKRAINNEFQKGVSWTWVDTIKKKVLGKRSDIAAQQDKFLNTIYTYHDLCDEASEKLTAVLNIQRELEDFSEFDPQYYQGELNTLKLDTEELNSKLNQLQSNLERMRLEGMVEPLRETLKSTLELIAKLLVVLRVNPSSSIKINSQPFGLSPKGPTRKRKLVKTDGSEVP